MARILPNDPCPCGSDSKFKKCCSPFLKGEPCDNPDRLIRARYSALVNGDAKFLWETLHPSSPRKMRDTWNKFEREVTSLRNLDYRKLRLLDAKIEKDQAVYVQWVEASEGEHDLSYLEESTFRIFEGRWHYLDGLRRSALRLGCLPESVRIGDLETLFLHESHHN